MPSRHAVLLTLSGDSNCPLWSYLHTGTLPRLISFVSHSYATFAFRTVLRDENTGGVGVFFPFWNSLVGCRAFDPGNERLSKSSTDYCQLITNHCPLTCANPVGVNATLGLSPLAATLMDLLASVANKRLTAGLSPLDATLTKNQGYPLCFSTPTFVMIELRHSSRGGGHLHSPSSSLRILYPGACPDPVGASQRHPFPSACSFTFNCQLSIEDPDPVGTIDLHSSPCFFTSLPHYFYPFPMRDTSKIFAT